MDAVMETNPQGWKTRQAKARAKKSRRNMTMEERLWVREVRQRHKMEGAEPQPAPEPPVVAAKPADGRPDPDKMDWTAMAAELRAAGKFVPPKIGEEKLRQRLREKRDAEKEAS